MPRLNGYLILFFVLFIVSSRIHAQQLSTIAGANPPMIKYGTDDFGGNSQIWNVIQSHQGLMYVASFGGILEFDGETWKVIEPSLIQSFKDDGKGRIYAAGYECMGYLEEASDGAVKYNSLLEKLPKEVDVVLIRDIHVIEHKVFFIAHEYVYIYDAENDSFSTISSENQMYPSFVFDDRLLIMVDQKGLFEVKADSLIMIPEGEYWADMTIDNIVPLGENKFLTLSSKFGAHVYSNQTPQPSNLFNNPYYLNNQLFGAARFSNGHYGFCFLTGGFVLTDAQMKPLLLLDKATGINNQVHSVYQDKENNLWISTNDGLIYLNVTFPISKVSEPNGLEGSVNQTIIHNAEQYVISYAGTFYRGLPNQINVLDPQERFFKKVENSEIGGLSLISSEDWLFSAHTRKKGVISDHEFIPILENNNTYHASAVYAKDDQIIITTKENGNELEVLKIQNGKWKHYKSIVDDRLPKDIIHTIVYDEKHKCYWAASTYSTVLKFKLNNSFDAISEILILNDDHGLPSGSQNKVFLFENRVYIATSNGLMYYAEDDQMLKKDTRFGEYFDKRGIYSLAKENEHSYWYLTTNQEIGHLTLNTQTNEIVTDTTFFATLNPGSLTHYFELLNDSTLAIGSLDGYYVVQTNKTDSHHFNFEPIIRSVSILKNDSVIYNGSKNVKTDYSLDHEYNSLNFEYSAPFFKGISKVMYRTKLEGFDDSWSEWTEKNEQDITNIPFGEYSFSVQARNVFGETSSVTTFEFEIKPPSYFAWWAFMSYLLILIFIIYIIVRLNARRLIRKNLELEETIKERVIEIEEQKDIIAKSLVEKESLLKEIHHRVKNNLQIIASLLYLQSGKFEDEDFKRVLEEGQGRVRSMALIHQKLYENDDLKSIPFDEYLTELVGEIRSSFGMGNVTLNIKADNIYFDVDTAVPLGLIVNELATNAFKYAFGASTNGSFSISLTEEGGAYQLNVNDNGLGLPEEIDIKKTKSLGLRLVRMLSQQLEGDFSFENKNGTRFQLTFAA